MGVRKRYDSVGLMGMRWGNPSATLRADRDSAEGRNGVRARDAFDKHGKE